MRHERLEGNGEMMDEQHENIPAVRDQRLAKRGGGGGGRRLKWLFRAVLLAAALWLLPPTRSWLDQLIAQQLDPHLSLHGLRWHTKPFVAELRQFDWQSPATRHGLALSAERAWFAIEAEALLDAQIVAPKVVVQNARLRVTAPKRLPQSVLQVWQGALDEQLASLDWHNIPLRFGERLGETEQGGDWRSRMEGWLTRSAGLAKQAAEYQQSTLSLDNPLRLESEQARVIGKLQALAQEQSSVQQQFTLLLQLLDAKLKRIDDHFNKEAAELAQRVKQQTGDKLALRTAAQALVQSAAQNAWCDLENFARLGDALCQADWGPRRVRGNNVRADQTWIECSEIVMDASLLLPLASQPLQLVGSYQRSSGEQHSARSHSAWQLYIDAVRPTRVVASNRTDKPSVTDLQILSTAHDAPEGENAHLVSINRLVLACDQDNVSGELTLLPSDWQPLLSIPSEKRLTLKVSGMWDAIEFEPAIDVLPDWFMDAMQHMLGEELEREQNRMLATLRESAAQRKSEMQRLSEQLRTYSANTDRHQTEIAASEKTLKEFFSQLDKDYEFARRPEGTRR